MSILGIISFLVFVATLANAGVTLSPPQQNSADSVSNFDAISQAFENKLLALVIVQASLYVIGTFALMPLVIFVKSRINSDPSSFRLWINNGPRMAIFYSNPLHLLFLCEYYLLKHSRRETRSSIHTLDTIQHNGFIHRRINYLNIKLKVLKASDMKNFTILIPKHHKVFGKLKSFILLQCHTIIPQIRCPRDWQETEAIPLAAIGVDKIQYLESLKRLLNSVPLNRRNERIWTSLLPFLDSKLYCI
ncbi:hypothetical protein M422DRAFT_47837 [Sphaerobolus stellatus SS14]|uniref:LAGLIDADG endonuclease n=1 Tax=Sphaerobolus stellatus (strain SS14) TaxID=990650 RepID=A0A0C9VXJ1_SPHS4|nr:hypothetical protein M422DRAFT_47837 [Sphaerobolus stellatus SS14]